MKKVILILTLLLIMTTLMACSTNGEADSVPPIGDVPSTESPNEGEVPPNGETESPDGGSTDQPNGDSSEDEQKPPEEHIPEPIVEYDTWLVATAVSVNVRESPTSRSRVLGTIRRGEGLGLITRDAKWYKVYYKGKQAYISSSYVREVRTPKSASQPIERIVSEGKRLLGYPYVWGSQRYHWGNGVLNRNFRMGEFDCSALTQYMFYKGAGINLDVTTRSQVLQGKVVRGDTRRGDLMFFTNHARRHKKGIEKVGHVALYLGDNYILHTAVDYALIEEISGERWDNYLVSKRFF